ncbi:MAG: ribonuclease R [Aestuariivirga sp.]
MPKRRPASIPGEAQILEFIRNSPSKVGKREIARAFGVKGSGKIDLKAILKSLERDGKLAREKSRVREVSSMPMSGAVEIEGIDEDGELFGRLIEWDETIDGPAKPLLIEPARRQPAPGPGDRVFCRIEPFVSGRYRHRGRIVSAIAAHAKKPLGIFRRNPDGRGGRVIEIDKKARHEIAIPPAEENGAQDGDLVEVSVDRGRRIGLPTGRVIRRRGNFGDQRNISLIAILNHAIPHEFPRAVLAESEALKPFKTTGRADLRKVPFITIDPEDARDHDDAVWAVPDEKGGIDISVAIADVAAYVHPRTALDREARIRGNSVYFPDRVVPMLPERISNDLCSLVEGKDRPVIVCHMHFDADGHKTKHRFERGVMRSAAKLSYQEAQAAIDGRANAKTAALLDPVLKPLWEAYGILMKGRRRREPLELDLPERKLVLDAHGLIERVVSPERLDAHKLIEEFMIQANVSAAESLNTKNATLLYRVHEPPTREKAHGLNVFLKTIDLALPLGQALKPKHFNHLLRQVKDKDYAQLVNEVVLRSQAQAVYAPDQPQHFGLSLKLYAHFTSPIRRYADLVVHRALIRWLDLGSDGLTDEERGRIRETGELVSDAERRAMAAERETVDRLIASHLATKTGAEFQGRIAGVVGAGLFIRLNETGADGFVPVSTLGTERFGYHEATHSLIGFETGRTYRLGDTVTVKLVEAAPISGGLKFEMISDGTPGRPISGRRFRHSRPPKRGKGRH